MGRTLANRELLGGNEVDSNQPTLWLYTVDEPVNDRLVIFPNSRLPFPPNLSKGPVLAGKGLSNAYISPFVTVIF